MNIACRNLSRKLILTNITESVVPSWNPYFQLEDNKCTGIWSEQIIETLARTRPAAAYFEKVYIFITIIFILAVYFVHSFLLLRISRLVERIIRLLS